jgi:hypothetical protein
MQREQQKLQFRGTPNLTRPTIQSLSLPVTLERCNHHLQTRLLLLKTASQFTRGNRRIGSDRTRQRLLPPPSVPPHLLISSSKHLLNSTHRGWRINIWFVKWGLTSCFGQVSSFVLTPKTEANAGVMSGVCGKLDYLWRVGGRGGGT